MDKDLIHVRDVQATPTTASPQTKSTLRPFPREHDLAGAAEQSHGKAVSRTRTRTNSTCLGDEMNPKRVYGSYTLIGVIVVMGI